MCPITIEVKSFTKFIIYYFCVQDLSVNFVNAMKKTTVKKIFIFFLLYLPLQYAAVGIVGLVASEPWPAFVLPAFQNVDTTPQQVTVLNSQLTVIDDEGNIHDDIKPGIIFSGIPGSQMQGFLRTHLGDSLRWSKKGESARKWLSGRFKKSYPSIEMKSLHMKWQRMYYNFSSASAQVDSVQTIEEFSVLINDE